MPRKGSQKVRTGCITCKVRKVKCDETKPSCSRCTTTGRVCDGHGPRVDRPRQSTLEGVASLHQPHIVFPGTTAKEGRALQYFCETAGPAMSGTLDPYFWTHLVMQLGANEPAVKHALVAISVLFEQADGSQEDITAGQRLAHQRQGLHHYNAAIRELKTKDLKEKQSVVLVVCLLFICIEALRSDVQSAVRHGRHGIEILKAALPNSGWIKDHLLPIFRRLSVSAFYFSDNDGIFLDMPDLWEPAPRSFTTVYDAQRMFDVIIARISHLTLVIAQSGQKTDADQEGTRTQASDSDEHRAEQAIVKNLFEKLLYLFAQLIARIHHVDASGKRLSSHEQYQKKKMQVFMLTRYEAARIWIEMAFEGETPRTRDKFLPNFQRVLKQLQWLQSQMPQVVQAATSQQSPQFMFEMGFTAIIFYFVSVFPYPEMRLDFLRLMQLFGLPKENLWDRDVLMAAERKIIEDENGIKLEGSEWPFTLLSDPGSLKNVMVEGSSKSSRPFLLPPAGSDSLIDDSASFVFNKTLQSHPWCSMPWSIEIGSRESVDQ
ncbi:hypothetical protein BDP81DRAFT_361849 [Colletotrichum phormii]|uniref:Zn(2)-C6 fungal-type domain-containing protein n=1 Tax=Colletotrichum phormii TaxID=359342 RepID=A0AAI9ZED9_9PEZI|nr:uncharacterized protein BDP81DRAFT_361849 [Colletotrichum phormii]KAK1621864.1 hypothetical protein BDP81DRAFT_361849 [Colletotrichum phormii]